MAVTNNMDINTARKLKLYVFDKDKKFVIYFILLKSI